MEVWLRNEPRTLDPLRHLLLCTLQQAEEDILEQTTISRFSKPLGLRETKLRLLHPQL
ncbi:MAG: hypothetical protein ACK532_09250 [Acidobacteriota bacterium]